MKKYILYFLLALMVGSVSCIATDQNQEAEKSDVASFQQGTFGYDLNFLNQYDSVVVLESGNGKSKVIVSPKYQAKVFTSTAQGNEGLSFGWVNYKAFSAPIDEHMNAYGGENRFWLGPEGGKFSLFFKPGSDMVFANWNTPAAFDTESWNVVAQGKASVALQKQMQLLNYSGTQLQLRADRTVAILNRQEIAESLGLSPDSSIKEVGYKTTNTITNTGASAWTEASGMPCIWILDMFKPTPATTIVIPFEKTAADSFKKVVTTDYFGEIPADRLKHTEDLLFFKADGKSRGKLGIRPQKAKPVAGSYDAANGVLTVTLFDVASDANYLNQEWNTTRPTFSGDAVNAYNDGPLADGTQMGPFYEIESVSPAASLKPGASLSHHHSVFHFTGPEASLDRIAKKIFGVSLASIKGAF